MFSLPRQHSSHVDQLRSIYPRPFTLSAAMIAPIQQQCKLLSLRDTHTKLCPQLQSNHARRLEMIETCPVHSAFLFNPCPRPHSFCLIARNRYDIIILRLSKRRMFYARLQCS
ncbi:hypothetical protein A0H81_08668 [Grifola frondosa]|uniref:Uncharacterized protein n=1 Tax=Grifola frondosa TaxID=5627 RepID=A0A1C7M8X0_GRIFR|nr:hypothetical protein A0H81_08668 [Grifola frondosa]